MKKGRYLKQIMAFSTGAVLFASQLLGPAARQKTNVVWAAENNYILSYSYNGHRYAITEQSMTWSEAKSYCESQGGHLATITSQGEYDILCSLSASHTDLWLGGTNTSGSWEWITGETWSWKANGDMAEEGNYVVQDGGGTWHAAHEQSPYRILCEWDSGGSSDSTVDYDNASSDSGNNSQGSSSNSGGSSSNSGGSSSNSGGSSSDSGGSSSNSGGSASNSGGSSGDNLSFSYGSSRYEIIATRMTWTEASSYCMSQGGHLATITSSGEKDAVENAMLQRKMQNMSIAGAWVGGMKSSSGWIWNTGESWSIENWAGGEPKTVQGQGYLQIDPEAGWHCDGNGAMAFAICEWDSYGTGGLSGGTSSDGTSSQGSSGGTSSDGTSSQDSSGEISEDNSGSDLATDVMGNEVNEIDETDDEGKLENVSDVKKIQFTKEKLSITVGKSKYVPISISPDNIDLSDLTWEIEDESVAEMDLLQETSATIAAVKSGKTVLTVSDETKKIKAQLQIIVVPKNTKFVEAVAGKKQLGLRWKIAKKGTIDGYQIEYATSKVFSSSKKMTIKDRKTTDCILYPLKKGKTYYFRIRTFKYINHKKTKLYSSWSSARTKKIT